jgi:hypothetical protein
VSDGGVVFSILTVGDGMVSSAMAFRNDSPDTSFYDDLLGIGRDQIGKKNVGARGASRHSAQYL